MTAPPATLASLAALTERLGDCSDLDQVLTVALDSMAELFEFEHSMLLLLDETGTNLFTIASHGYGRAGIGSEVAVGVGVIGSVAATRRSRRIVNLQRLLSYARQARGDGPEDDIPLPGLDDANSQLAAPATVSGRLLGVLAVESRDLGAYGEEDEHLLSVVAHIVAAAIEIDRLRQGPAVAETPTPRHPPSRRPAPGELADAPAVVRFYASDGSTFVDGDYLIKGVPGRILHRLLRDHLDTGRTEFTNREIRLDPSLELPSFRDNLESRLILLKRRLDERESPVRIEKTGRGRFRIVVLAHVSLSCGDGA